MNLFQFRIISEIFTKAAVYEEYSLLKLRCEIIETQEISFPPIKE